MSDREKVIRGLKCCQKCSAEEPEFGCDNCPYNEISICVQDCRSVLCKDALELLGEQEPVRPKEERLNDVDSIYRCGNCGTYFYYRQQKYCAICGRMAKWDAAY